MAVAMTLPTEQPSRFRHAYVRCGFTLVELLLVLVLLGVIIGISMPYFVHSIRGNRLRVAGRTLVTVSGKDTKDGGIETKWNFNL